MSATQRPRCPACDAENVRFYRDGLPRYCNKSDCRKRAYYDRGINGRDVTATVDEAEEKRAKRLAYLSERIERTEELLSHLRQEHQKTAQLPSGTAGILTDARALAYIKAYREGKFKEKYGSQDAVARSFGLSRGAFQAILAGRNRPYLQDQAA